MKLWSCFPVLIRKKKQKDKVNEFISRQDALDKNLLSKKPSTTVGNQKNWRRSGVKVMSVESPVAEHSAAEGEEAYAGKEELRPISDSDLQRGEAASCEKAMNQSRNQGIDFDSCDSKPMQSPRSSTMARVCEWLKNLEIHHPPSPLNDTDDVAEDISYSPPPKRNPPWPESKEISYANSIVQSQSSISTTAHIYGAGLKVIPQIVHLTNLRCVNLSSNCIMTITPGLLPKGLHSLNLSRNKISTIEGLREQTRLRVLDLSYNCITRIEQGLSNCLLIKELYLAGNKISNVEGLHRLLKLRILDLSFNKISTAKALGPLVSNYNSLQALTLSGNPIQSNMSEEQLRKAVNGLFPKLLYLNKQITKTQRIGEVIRDSVAKAALGNSSWRRRYRQVGSVSNRRRMKNNGNVGQTSLRSQRV